TGGREDFVSRSSPLHCKSASRFGGEVLLLSCFPFLWLSSSGGDHANRVLRHGKRDGYLSGNHSSIGGSWPIAISGYPRRHSVQWVTRGRSTQGRSHGLILTSNRAS